MSLGPGFESVLAAAKIGAPWAWSCVYGEIAGPVAGFFRARGASDPQSATGDVFFELSRRLEAFEGTEESFTTLVFAIAYKRLLAESLYPRRRSHSSLADKVLDRIQSEVEVEVDDYEKIPASVRSAFEALNADQRDVLSLRIIAGLTVEQTAEVIGSTIEGVKAAQRKGLAKVRGAMPPPMAVLA